MQTQQAIYDNARDVTTHAIYKALGTRAMTGIRTSSEKPLVIRFNYKAQTWRCTIGISLDSRLSVMVEKHESSYILSYGKEARALGKKIQKYIPAASRP